MHEPVNICILFMCNVLSLYLKMYAHTFIYSNKLRVETSDQTLMEVMQFPEEKDNNMKPDTKLPLLGKTLTIFRSNLEWTL